jgi:hypothetical protein
VLEDAVVRIVLREEENVIGRLQSLSSVPQLEAERLRWLARRPDDVGEAGRERTARRNGLLASEGDLVSGLEGIVVNPTVFVVAAHGVVGAGEGEVE